MFAETILLPEWTIRIIKLSQGCIAAFDYCTAFVGRVHKVKLTSRQAVNFMDEITEFDMLDSDEEHEDDFTTPFGRNDDS